MLIISTSFGQEPQIGFSENIQCFANRQFQTVLTLFQTFFTSKQPPKIEILIEFHKQIKGKKTVPSHSILIHSGHVQALQKVIPAMIRRVSSVVSNADNPEIPTTWSARTPTSVPSLGLASATPFVRLLVSFSFFSFNIPDHPIELLLSHKILLRYLFDTHLSLQLQHSTLSFIQMLRGCHCTHCCCQWYFLHLKRSPVAHGSVDMSWYVMILLWNYTRAVGFPKQL